MRRTTLSRWTSFNLVGVAGIAVQLAVLAGLTRLGLDVSLATALAVETALLHNFAWHQRWTWRDRPSGSAGETFRRFARFQALNGLISLVGNVALTTALARAGMDPVVANLLAIAACSLVNFAAGERLVFRRAGVTAALVVIGAPLGLQAQGAPALRGWDTYTLDVERRHAEVGGPRFFALDTRQVNGWRERARSGDVPMVEIQAPGLDAGKIHHWAGAVYVPNVTVQQVVERLQELAGRESEFYDEVTASRLIDRAPDRVRVFMRLQRDAGPITANYNTEHTVEYRRHGMRATSRSLSTRIAELAHAGTPREREKGPGEDHGFLWRLNAYWRFEQAGAGVLIECESVSLSRDVPFLLRPFISGVVEGLAKESLERTLTGLRTYLSTSSTTNAQLPTTKTHGSNHLGERR